MDHWRFTVAGRSALLRQTQQGRARGRGRLRVEALTVEPIRFLWTNWASLIDQWNDSGGGFFSSSFFSSFGLLWAGNMQSLGQHSLCARHKTSISAYGGYLYQGLCVCSWTDLAQGLVWQLCFVTRLKYGHNVRGHSVRARACIWFKSMCWSHLWYDALHRWHFVYHSLSDPKKVAY